MTESIAQESDSDSRPGSAPFLRLLASPYASMDLDFLNSSTGRFWIIRQCLLPPGYTPLATRKRTKAIFPLPPGFVPRIPIAAREFVS